MGRAENSSRQGQFADHGLSIHETDHLTALYSEIIVSRPERQLLSDVNTAAASVSSDCE